MTLDQIKASLQAGTSLQYAVLTVWVILAVYLINRGGRNNRDFQIVVSSGFRLIVIGCAAAAIVGALGEPQSAFTSAAFNFVLVLSAAIGANYIAHANMSLRDFPNKIANPKETSSSESKSS